MGACFKRVVTVGLAIIITLGAMAVSHAEADKTATKQPCIVVFDGKQMRCVPLQPKTIFVTSGKYDGDLQSAGKGLPIHRL